MTSEQRLDAFERELGRTKRLNRWLLVAFGVSVVAFTGFTVSGQEKHVRAVSTSVRQPDSAFTVATPRDR